MAITTSRPGRARTKPGKRFALLETQWGLCGVVWRRQSALGATQEGGGGEEVLCRIVSPGLDAAALRQLLTQEEEAHKASGPWPPWWQELTDFLQGYFARQPPQNPADKLWDRWGGRLDLDRLTEFQRTVLRATSRIPPGQLATYGQLAMRLGRAGAARAVGGALGANPWPILIPCHRVVGSSGAMTGFSAPGGCQTKQRMIQWERRPNP